MKNRIIKIFNIIISIVLLIPVFSGITANAFLIPDANDNVAEYEPTAFGTPVQSYLSVGKEGNITIIDTQRFITSGEPTRHFYIKEFSSKWRLISEKKLEFELPLWGGFYEGKKYNFAVFGDENPKEKDSKEVIRIVKYDKNWKRLGAASVYGANTKEPFAFGKPDITQMGDTLIFRGCHTMYKSSDGLNHQATMTVTVDIPTMTVTGINSKVAPREQGYVSHSFAQFVRTYGNDIGYVDLGDAYPRAVTLSYKKSGAKNYTCADLFPILSDERGVYTGVSLGGFEITKSSCIVVGSSVNQKNRGDKYVQNVFVSVVPRSDISTSKAKTIWLTNYPVSSNKSAPMPYLLKINDKKLLVLWTEQDRKNIIFYDDSYMGADKEKTLCWQFLDGSGNPVSEVYKSKKAVLSSCRPILYKNQIVWYASGILDSNVTSVYYYTGYHPDLCFYSISLDNPGKVKAHEPVQFTDVSSYEYYDEAVCWAVDAGIVSGTGKYTFSPDAACTRAQALTFLWRVAGSPAASKKSNFKDVPKNAYYAKAVDWAVEKGITSGTGKKTFSPNSICTKAQIITFIWKAAGAPKANSSWMFEDVPAGAYYRQAVAFGIKKDITAGIAAAHFGPNETCTRAQIITFLWRYAKAKG